MVSSLYTINNGKTTVLEQTIPKVHIFLFIQPTPSASYMLICDQDFSTKKINNIEAFVLNGDHDIGTIATQLVTMNMKCFSRPVNSFKYSKRNMSVLF